MVADLKSIQDYIHAIEKKLATGDATEHTHRAALGALIESLALGISATNEPKHIECGAPDFVIRKGVTTIGYNDLEDCCCRRLVLLVLLRLNSYLPPLFVLGQAFRSELYYSIVKVRVFSFII